MIQHPIRSPFGSTERGPNDRSIANGLIGFRLSGLITLVFLISALVNVQAEVGYVYDEAGRLVQVISPSGESAIYRYDAVGNVIAVERTAVGEVTLSEVSPDRGPVGTSVTLFGVGFSTTPSGNTVKVNGIPAAVSAATPTSLTLTVPSGATSGAITVQVGTRTATSTIPFTVSNDSPNDSPVITAVTPTIGSAGTAITVTGKNFAALPENNFVHLNVTQTKVTASTATTLNLVVPEEATSGPIKLRTATGTAISPNDFIVVPAGKTPDNIGLIQRTAIDGPPLVINKTAPGKIAMLQFHGLRDQSLGLGLSEVTLTGGNANLIIKTPKGTDLISQTYISETSLDLPRLPETGTYSIVITPSDAATVAATVTLTSDLVSSLSPNQKPKTFTSQRLGQNARYQFSVATEKNLNLVFTDDTFNGSTYVTVYKPKGDLLTNTSLYRYDKNVSTTLSLNDLTTSGIYTVLVSPVLGTGSIRTALMTDLSGDISPDGNAKPISLPVGRNGTYRFRARAGSYLGLGITDLKTSPPASYLAVAVDKPDGTKLTDCPAVYQSAKSTSCDLANLPDTGIYSVRINNGVTRSDFNLRLIPDVTGKLLRNGPAKVFSSNVIGQNAHFSFKSNRAQTDYTLEVLNDTFPGATYVYVNGSDKSQYGYASSYPTDNASAKTSIKLEKLPKGQYTVYVTPSDVATGSIRIKLTSP